MTTAELRSPFEGRVPDDAHIPPQEAGLAPRQGPWSCTVLWNLPGWLGDLLGAQGEGSFRLGPGKGTCPRGVSLCSSPGGLGSHSCRLSLDFLLRPLLCQPSRRLILAAA